MRKAEILGVTLLALGWLGCSQAPPAAETKPADTRVQDAADIKALEDRFLAAVKAKDLDAIMQFYVPDDSLIVFDATPPRQYNGAQAYRKDWQDFIGMFPGTVEGGISDLDVTVGGDVAYGHSIQNLVATMKNGKKLNMTVRVTDGYKKVNGKWLIAHEHVSFPVDLATGKADITSKP